MNVNESIWGTEYREYDTINARVGTMDFTDPDYTLYPPFTKNNLCEGGSNPSGGTLSNGCLYMGMINRPAYFNMEHDFDTSICYCACANPDLLICNYSAPMPAITDENTGAVTLPFKHMVNRSGAFPIALLDNYDYCVGKTSHTGNSNLIGNVHTPYYNQTSVIPKSYYEYVPNGINEGDYDTSSHRNASNNNLFFSYWRDFGLRSLFCVIYVVYFDGTYNATTGQPTNISDHKTLHWYETQTDEWKATHPILAAFGRPYIRRNIDGTYSKERSNNHIIIPDFSRFTIDYNPEHSDVWQPCVASSGTTPENCFPIFGGYRTGFTSTSGANAVSQFDTQLSTGGLCKQADIILGHGCRGVNENSGLANNSVGRRTFWLEMEGTAANLELIRKSMAGYGLFFADDVYDLADAGRDNDRWTDENMCLGVIDENGFTDGTYTRGTGNENANNFLWKTVSESRYNPDRPPPTPDNQYSDATVFNNIGNLATMFKRYVISASEVETLGKDLFKITDDLAVGSPSYDDYATEVNSSFLVSNPLDCIVSLRRFPMEIPKSNTYTNIKLGTHTINTSGYTMEKTAYTYLFEMPNHIYPNFGDSFLDYEPYTDYELYVPFCGTVKLNPRDIINRKLAVQLVVDFTTGTATGFVMSDNLVIETVNGNIAIDIPVSGINAATIASQLNNAIAQRETSYYSKMSQGFETAKSFINPLKMGGAVSNLAKSINAETSHQLADYNLTHQEATPHTIGAATPVGLWAIDLNCRLICYFPTGEVITQQGNTPKLNTKIYDFGATQGFATIETNTIGSYTGLVIAANPLTGSMTTANGKALTNAEIQLIITALSEGVIV